MFRSSLLLSIADHYVHCAALQHSVQEVLAPVLVPINDLPHMPFVAKLNKPSSRQFEHLGQ